MTTPARKRLMWDFKRLQKDPPVGISGAPQDNNIMHWNAVISGYFQVDSSVHRGLPTRTNPQYFGLFHGCFIQTFMLMEAYPWISYKTNGAPSTTSLQYSHQFRFLTSEFPLHLHCGCYA